MENKLAEIQGVSTACSTMSTQSSNLDIAIIIVVTL
jgi:hypothetical protein